MTDTIEAILCRIDTLKQAEASCKEYAPLPACDLAFLPEDHDNDETYDCEGLSGYGRVARIYSGHTIFGDYGPHDECSAELYENGRLVLEMKSEESPHLAINFALSWLGVQRGKDLDEWDALGMAGCCSNDEILTRFGTQTLGKKYRQKKT